MTVSGSKPVPSGSPMEAASRCLNDAVKPGPDKDIHTHYYSRESASDQPVYRSCEI